MKRTNRSIVFFGGTMLLCLLLAAALVIAAVSASGGIDHASIRIDGESMQLAGFGIGEGLVALVCVALALLAAVVIVPLAVLIPLALAALVLVGVLLVLAGVVAMLFSPLILFVLVVWFAVRAARRSGSRSVTPVRPDGGATIAR